MSGKSGDQRVRFLMSENLKIGIIGGGPSGSMSAILLAKKGHQVTIFEKRQTINRKLCGEYLCPQGVELLEKHQLKEKICHEFLPLNGMVLSSPQGIVVECTFPETKQKWNGISLNRQIFDQRLLNEAHENNVEIKYGSNIKSISKTTNGWSLGSENFEFFDFDFLIAADGKVSSVAKMLSHSAKLDTSRVAIHCYLPRKKFFNLRFGEMHIFNDGSYCGIDPINDDEVNVSFVFNVEKVKSNNLHQLCNQYLFQSKRLVEMFGEIPSDAEMKTITPLKNVNTFIAGNALAYVGDASGFIDPLTGEGIYNALLSADILVSALSAEEDLEIALKLYKKNKNKIQFQKKILNHAFQFVIRRPKICWLIALFIQKKKVRADLFVGIIGNIYSPFHGFIKMIMA